MIIPEAKRSMVNGTARSSERVRKTIFSDGLITYQEKYNKVVDAWSQCTDQCSRSNDGRDG